METLVQDRKQEAAGHNAASSMVTGYTDFSGAPLFVGDTICARVAGCSIGSWHERTGQIVIYDGDVCFDNPDLHRNIWCFSKEFPLLKDVIGCCKPGWPKKEVKNEVD